MCTILLLLHYYIHFTAFFPGQPGLEGTRNVNHSGFYWSKKRWGGSGISWTMCKSIAPRSRQITTPAPHHSVFTARIPFLPPNQQCQSTEAITLYTCEHVYKTQLSKRATSHFWADFKYSICTLYNNVHLHNTLRSSWIQGDHRALAYVTHVLQSTLSAHNECQCTFQ